MNLSINPTFALSKSRVSIERNKTSLTPLFVPFNFPPTKPPLSLALFLSSLLKCLYCSMVSLVYLVFDNLWQSSSKITSSFAQNLASQLFPTAMLYFLSSIINYLLLLIFLIKIALISICS